GTGDGLKRAVEIEHVKARASGGLRGGRLNRSVACADPSLAHSSGEIRDYNLDFIGAQPPQQVREQRDLFKTLAGFRNPPRGFDDFGEQHRIPYVPAILTIAARLRSTSS